MGQGSNPFKRKFRWTFEANINGFKIDPIYVKLPKRPEFKLEEIQQEDGSYKIVENSGKWLPIEMLVSDEHNPDLRSLWTFTASLIKDEIFIEAKGEMVFKLWDGAGNVMETWKLNKAQIRTVTFLDDSYPSSDACNIQFVIEYEGCEYIPGAIGFKSASGHYFELTDKISKDAPKIPEENKIDVKMGNVIITDGIVPSEYTTGYINITGDIPKKITINTDDMPKEIKCKPIIPAPPDKHV